MFFIYSLEIQKLTVKLYDFCRTKEGVPDLLDTIARNFISREEGERAAEDPYRDNVPDEQITKDGYFLRHSDKEQNVIDVYLRSTAILPGRVWNSYEVSCQKVMHFAVTEASMGLPIECTGKTVKTPVFETSRAAQLQADHMEELKKRLVSQRAAIDGTMNVKTRPIVVSDDESEEEDEILRKPPIAILKEKIDLDELFKAALKDLDEVVMMPTYDPPPPPPQPDW